MFGGKKKKEEKKKDKPSSSSGTIKKAPGAKKGPPSDAPPSPIAAPETGAFKRSAGAAELAALAAQTVASEPSERKYIAIQPPPAASPNANGSRVAGLEKSGSGEEVPSAAAAASSSGERVEDGIVFSGEVENGIPVIKGGSLEKLVERLTYNEYTDQKYIKAFMLTFRSFTTPLELFGLLKQRYYIDPPEGADPDAFDNSVRRVIRLRVSNVLKYWIQQGIFDFQEDEQLRNEFLEFVQNDMTNTGMASAGQQLVKIFERQMSGEEDAAKKISFGQRKAPMPHLPKNVGAKSLSLRDFHPEEIARQLTLIEYSLYKKIKPWECLNQNWMKADKENKAPNIIGMITRFNEVSTWVASEICKPVDLKDRIATLQFVIEIAEYCKALNNFNALMEIVSGLNSAPVHRLKLTWAGLSKQQQKSFEEMHSLMSRERSYKNFRQFLHNVNPPAIPYLGMYLTDLTFIEEGNKDKLPDGSISFFKRQKLSEIIAEIQIYQDVPYCLDEVKFIQDYLMNVESLPEEQCYKLSLKRETRSGVALTAEDQEQDEEEETFGEMQKVDGYHFDEPDTDMNIKFEKVEGSLDTSFVPIKGGTLIKLVERLTYHNYRDINYVWAFLMTYRTFTTPTELLQLLTIRFNMPLPKNPSKQQLAKFVSTRQIPIHLRIFNVLKSWVTSYYIDFKEDHQLVENLISFVDSCAASNNILEKPAASVKQTLDKKAAEKQVPEPPLLGSKSGIAPESPIGVITEYDDEEFAKQLTLFEYSIFKAIEPRECLCTSFDDPSSSERAPHITQMKTNYDLIKRWAGTQIVSQPDTQSRFKMVSHLVKIADALLDLKNFNSLAAIINGMLMLGGNLAATWEWVPTAILDKFSDLQGLVKRPKKLMEKEKSEEGSPSAIPYLDLYLRQLQGIHDMFPDVTDPGSLINFEKRRKIYDVFKVWEKYQTEPFSFTAEPSFQAYLEHTQVLPEDEIKKLARSMNNDPAPSTRPLMSELIVPTRFKTVVKEESKAEDWRMDSSEQLISSDNTSPRGAAIDEGVANQIKTLMMHVLSEDKALMQGLVSAVKQALSQELQSGLKDYASNARDELSILHSQFGSQRSEVGWEAAHRIARRKFPQSEVVSWKTVDQDGFVYGWKEEVGLFVVDNTTLVSVTAHVEKSYLGSLLRIAGLYVSEMDISDEDSQGLRVMVLAPTCSPDIREFALTQGIEVVEFN